MMLLMTETENIRIFAGASSTFPQIVCADAKVLRPDPSHQESGLLQIHMLTYGQSRGMPSTPSTWL